jgi:hypothetical protein
MPTNVDKLEPHLLADVFPLLEGKELQELADDIKKNGLLEPIMLFQGKILDGRNRYNAVKLAEYKLEPHEVEVFENIGGDPVEFVISKNIKRRHLTPDQRAMIAAELYDKLPKQQHGGDRKSRVPNSTLEDLPSAGSQLKKVATKMEVSTKQVKRASSIKHKDPKKAAQVKTGTKKMVEAEQELNTKKQQSEIKDGRIQRAAPVEFSEVGKLAS